VEEIKYEIFPLKIKENKKLIKAVSIRVEVSLYGFRPPGNRDDWIKYAKEYKEKNNLDKVKIYYETQNKETGYTSDHYLCDV